MQPSQSEIQREFETLRDIRRRSSSQGGPGALLLDPDLPTQPPSPISTLSSSSQYWGAGSAESSTTLDAVPENTEAGGSSPSDDPFHLFWVPAHLHPELAPGEFRAFLKEHARGPPADGSASPTRSNSIASSDLGRKRSMLSRQYKPREGDGVEEERVVPLQRSKSRLYDGPQLTINDLQKLEELAEEASQSDDPSKLRNVLRRSLSLNVAPSDLDTMDDLPDMGDDADIPIIVQRPNHSLRRAQRTKIRKPGLVGDGNGHRFAASTRRRSGGRAATIDLPGSSDISSSDHGHADSELNHRGPPHQHDPDEESEELYAHRRNTYSEESMIYDSYARDEDEKDVPYLSTSPTMVVELPISRPHLVSPPELQSISPVLHHPQPQRHLTPPITQPAQTPSRTPSPDAVSQPPSPEDRRRPSPSAEPLAFLTAPPASTDKRKDKEKDKKSILRKWGGDKGAKKGGKEKDRDRDQKEKEKEGGFFGSLFGGGKKKQEEHSAHILGHGGSGPATAAALLGASKSSKVIQPPPSPQLAGAYARYPIHVERAVYRLSHIKLANPRRPLYEQVLISNLMFWYLGVINKTQQSPGQNQTQNQTMAAGQTGAAAPQVPAAEVTPPAANSAEKERADAEEREKAREREREERARAERERLEREQERERMEQKRETRRGSLTKAPAPGTPGQRRAEMPVKGPQYGLQHQAIEQEYGAGLNMGPGPVPIARTASAPPGPAPSGYNGGYSHRPSQSQSSQSKVLPSGQSQNQNYYYSSNGTSERSGGSARSTQTPNLPPGAMPPTTFEQNWLASPLSSSNQRNQSSNRSPPPTSDSPTSHRPPRPSRSPPPSHRNDLANGAKLAGRSLSANAVAPVQTNGNLKKKVASAAATVPARRPRSSDGFNGGEEEDVPLAVVQQQRRK